MRATSSRRMLRKCGWEGIEQLEPRALLANSAYPTIGELSNPNNTVVRLQTNFGDIDFELFDTAAPVTVANFLKYVRDGDFDNTFFHRYAKNQDNSPFVIQGGLARLTNPTNTGTFNSSIETVPTDPAITNEFNQSNLTRTIAMARVGGQVNSATSQFFINLANNNFLDTVDQGFTVFGRVATDASWAVVQSIITTVVISNQGTPYNELPTTNGFTGTDVSADQMVTIRDAEIIKPQGVAAFYTHKYYFPEGFAGSTINEFLPIGNTGSSTAYYQVIVRSETRDPRPTGNVDFWYRDKVVATKTLAANRRGGETMSTFTTPANNLVPKQGKPYGIEVWSTSPLAVTLSHYDFGSSTIESFATAASTTWTMADVQKGTDIRDFAVWQNTSDLPATITAKFIFQGAAEQTFMFTTDAFRRGGLSINDLAALPAGRFSLQLTSDRPIFAALTHYKTSGTDKGGSTSLGITGTGARAGVLPLASSDADDDIADEISFVNPNGAGAIVTLIFSFSDSTPDFVISPPQLILAPNSRATYDISLIPSIQGKTFTVRYTSGSASIFATTLHIQHGDVASTPFAYTAATSHLFAEGFMNGARAGDDLFESIAVFNPNSPDFGVNPGQDANVTIRFCFTDGFVLAQDFTVAPGQRLENVLNSNAALLAQNANNRFYFSIEVVSDIPVIAMMSHYDLTLGNLQPSGGGITIGTQRGQIVALADL